MEEVGGVRVEMRGGKIDETGGEQGQGRTHTHTQKKGMEDGEGRQVKREMDGSGGARHALTAALADVTQPRQGE